MCFVSWHVKWSSGMCQAKVEQRGQNGWRGTEESKGFVFFIDLPWFRVAQRGIQM